MDMNINMNDSNIVSLRQVEETILSRVAPAFSFESHEKAYAWISEVLNRFGYHEKGRTKKEKISIRRYIKRFTTYSKSQLSRSEERSPSHVQSAFGRNRSRVDCQAT